MQAENKNSRFIIKINTKELRNSMYMACYMFFCLASELVALSSIHGIFGIGLLFLSFLPLMRKRYRNNRITIYSVLILIGVVIISLLRGNLHFRLLYIVGSALLAQFVLTRNFNLKMLNISYLIISAIIFVLGLPTGFEGVFVASRNYVSISIIFQATLLTIISYKQTKIVILWPAMVALFISICAVGRGGILASALLTVSVIFIRIENSKKMTKILFFLFLCLAPLFMWETIVSAFEASEQLERISTLGIQDGARESIYSAYLSHMDLKSILIGYDVRKDSTIHSYLDNPHNSFILMHSYFGILILIPFLLIIKSIIFHIKSKELFYVFLLLALLLRCFTDTTLMHRYDYIIMICVLHAFLKPNIRILEYKN